MIGPVYGEKDWRGQYDAGGVYHVLPNNDLREHEMKWHCECQPVFVLVEQPHGWGWVYEHWAFDLREKFEELDAK